MPLYDEFDTDDWRPEPAQAISFAQLLHRQSIYSTQPDLPPEPEPEPEPSDEVIVSIDDYRMLNVFTGHYLPGNTSFVLVSRAVIEAAARDYALPVPRMWGRDEQDTLPRRFYCDTCGRDMGLHDESPGNCDRCEVRPRNTRRALRSGGRRFGIEIEFSLPSNGRMPDDDLDGYDFDDDEVEEDLCGEPDCMECNNIRRRRLGMPSTSRDPMSISAVAAALTEAGVPTIAPGYTHEVFEDQWKLVTDGSVAYGYELVSPPLQWRNADQVRLACQALQRMGMRATDDCGLHVHHDVGDITGKLAPVLSKNFAALLPISQSLCASYRSRSQWCHPDNYYAELEAQFDGTSVRDFIAIDGERYRPLNWTCWPSYGTVEVRMHESTLDAEEILAWIAYTQSIVEHSMQGHELDPPANLDSCLGQLTIRRAANPTHVRHMLRLKAEQRNTRRRTSRAHSDFDF